MKAVKHARQILLWIPTTKVRILVSICLSIAVVTAAIIKNYNPSWELLAFLLVQQGLDISQYAVQRNSPPDDSSETDHSLNILPKEGDESDLVVKEPNKPVTTNISELG